MADMTISFTTSQGNRLAAYVGRVKQYVDGQGQPRSATNAESKQWVIEIVKSCVLSDEQVIVNKTAVANATPPAPFDPT